MNWLRTRLEEIGKTGADLSRALEIPTSRVYEMISGKRRIQTAEIGRTARFLQISEAELVARIEGRSWNANNKQSDENLIQIRENKRQPIGDISGNPLLLYRVVNFEHASGGKFMLYKEPSDEVPRPFFLKFSQDAFAIKALDDSNEPVYRRWDTLLVDPGGSTVIGEDHLFTRDLDPNGGLSVIGCLKESTASHWTVHQYGTKQDQELSKKDYPRAWPIVGRYNRR